MKRTILGYIDKIFDIIDTDLPKQNKYISFIFNGIEVESFTDEELKELKHKNVKVTIETIDVLEDIIR